MWFTLLGFSVGALGTLIGVGGGFILVPVLLHLYPKAHNEWITAVSLWVVAFNATSGSIAYYHKKRIHLRAAALFIVAGIPGTLIGVWIERLVQRSLFERIFAVALMAYSVFLIFKKEKKSEMKHHAVLSRQIYVEGAAISFFVGFAASFLGIGGGVIHVPMLSHLLGFPVHLAAGTSHMILSVTSAAATAANLINGTIQLTDPRLWQLGLGAAAGAQLGAALSSRVSGTAILKILAVALFLVGLRLAF